MSILVVSFELIRFPGGRGETLLSAAYKIKTCLKIFHVSFSTYALWQNAHIVQNATLLLTNACLTHIGNPSLLPVLSWQMHTWRIPISSTWETSLLTMSGKERLHRLTMICSLRTQGQIVFLADGRCWGGWCFLRGAETEYSEWDESKTVGPYDTVAPQTTQRWELTPGLLVILA